MTTEHRPRPATPPAGAIPTNELRRIPLPPLPHFKKSASTAQPAPAPPAIPEVAPTGAVTHVEMSELLGPRHEGGIEPVIEPDAPARTGATGATILNDLVDEIEKGLERELARTPMDSMTEGYRRILACATSAERRTDE